MIIVNCPWCDCTIEIEQLNCAIFRCGIFKESGNQINPHESQENCEQFSKNNLIHGCGKPFKVQYIQDYFIAIKCDYI